MIYILGGVSMKKFKKTIMAALTAAMAISAVPASAPAVIPDRTFPPPPTAFFPII